MWVQSHHPWRRVARRELDRAQGARDLLLSQKKPEWRSRMWSDMYFLQEHCSEIFHVGSRIPCRTERWDSDCYCSVAWFNSFISAALCVRCVRCNTWNECDNDPHWLLKCGILVDGIWMGPLVPIVVPHSCHQLVNVNLRENDKFLSRTADVKFSSAKKVYRCAAGPTYKTN